MIGMGKLEVQLPEQIDEALSERQEVTGQNKSEITRTALVRELNL